MFTSQKLVGIYILIIKYEKVRSIKLKILKGTKSEILKELESRKNSYQTDNELVHNTHMDTTEYRYENLQRASKVYAIESYMDVCKLHEDLTPPIYEVVAIFKKHGCLFSKSGKLVYALRRANFKL